MKGIFITITSILLIFNFIYCSAKPDVINSMYVGALTGLVSTVLAVGVISGVQILGSGLNSESIKIIFGVGCILNMLFRINIAGFPLGIGLCNTILDAFPSTEFIGIGYFISSTLAMLALISGLLSIMGGD